MKRTVVLSLLFSLAILSASGQSVEWPVRLVDGYGPFLPTPFFAVWENAGRETIWSKTYQKLTGIPSAWQEGKQGAIQLDNRQFAHQHRQAGTLSADDYRELQTVNHWPSGTQDLSDKLIKCFVYVVTGIDTDGRQQVMIDTNNNLDFGDEQPFVPPAFSYASRPDSSDTHRFIYEHYHNGRIITGQVGLAVWRSSNTLLFGFPVYALAQVPGQTNGDQIAVSPSGFSTLAAWSGSTAVVINDSLLAKRTRAGVTGKIIPKMMIKENEYLTLSTGTYQYGGIDPVRQVIRLKKTAGDDSLYSTQKGYRAHPFGAAEFTSRKPLSLADYRGKYVFLDFWGTWCAPCRAEMPGLKDVYARTSRTDIEFIGIVANDTPENLKACLDKEGITWPQIMADATNKLLDTYQIRSYPNTLLIDPQGRVVTGPLTAANLRVLLTRLINVRP